MLVQITEIIEKYNINTNNDRGTQMVSCNECKNNKCDQHGKTYIHYCDKGHWDRTDEEQDWLHDDEEFDEYLTTRRSCSDFEPK